MSLLFTITGLEAGSMSRSENTQSCTTVLPKLESGFEPSILEEGRGDMYSRSVVVFSIFLIYSIFSISSICPFSLFPHLINNEGEAVLK